MLSTPVTTRLRDGTPIMVRLVGPHDKHLLEIGFEHLSHRSRRLRFLHPVSRLSGHGIEAVTGAPDAGHVACGALDQSSVGSRALRPSRVTRPPQPPGEAQFGVAVVDSHGIAGHTHLPRAGGEFRSDNLMRSGVVKLYGVVVCARGHDQVVGFRSKRETIGLDAASTGRRIRGPVALDAVSDGTLTTLLDHDKLDNSIAGIPGSDRDATAGATTAHFAVQGSAARPRGLTRRVRIARQGDWRADRLAPVPGLRTEAGVQTQRCADTKLRRHKGGAR